MCLGLPVEWMRPLDAWERWGRRQRLRRHVSYSRCLNLGECQKICKRRPIARFRHALCLSYHVEDRLEIIVGHAAVKLAIVTSEYR